MNVEPVWTVENITYRSQMDGRDDVVYVVYWRVDADQDTGRTTMYGSVEIPYQNNLPYTPYADLTETQILGWVHDIYGPDAISTIESSLAIDVRYETSPSIAVLPLPGGV
jgi:hypothetical protein